MIDKQIIIDKLNSYIINNTNIVEYENYLESNYSKYIEKENNSIFNIINKLDNEISNSYLDDDYFNDHYKELLFRKDINTKLYYIDYGNGDIIQEDFIENGTLALKICLLVDYNYPIKERLKNIDEIKKYLKNIENELKNKLDVPVRILVKEKLIAPKNLNIKFNIKN